MFPTDITDWLKAKRTAEYAAYLVASFSETAQTLDSLGIRKDSELGHLYLHHGPWEVRGWYPLVEADEIEAQTMYAEEELEVQAGSFFALSGIEGEGIILYEKKTGAVFDVEFGQFEALASGTLKPTAPSVVEFLRWCKARHSEE
jgi:hypothetical protein